MSEWEPVRFILQLAFILVAAVAAGHAARKYLKLPSLIGEIGAGIVLGPFALGGMHLLGAEPLFPVLHGAPVSPELQAFSTLAAVLLLFVAGLEADLKAFVARSVASLIVGAGGVIISFSFGAGFACLAGVSETFTSPPALLLGAATSATSIGVAARVLADRQKSASPEGVTIMGAAVLDDVLVILALSIILGSAEEGKTAGFGLAGLKMAAYAFGAWLLFFAFSLLAAKPLTMWMKRAKEHIVMATLALGVALVIAGLFELAGLSLVLGAYVAGLALSPTDVVDVIHNRLRDVYHVIVPIFFCVLGMHVDPAVLVSVLGISLLYTLVAFAAKLFGCGGPALLAGYNVRGAFRIGSGMVPRGEVALIIATLGLGSGLIGHEVFSMVMTMTLVSILIGPFLFARALEGGSGLRSEKGEKGGSDLLVFSHLFPDPDIASLLMARICRAFRNEEFFAQVIPGKSVEGYSIRKESMVITMRREDCLVTVRANRDGSDMARLMIVEELIQFEELVGTFHQMGSLGTSQERLLMDMAGDEDVTRADF